MPAKTNAARILDAAGIYYELREYEVDEEDLSARRVAEKIGMPPEQVFKTLVARGDRTGILMAAIPANTELDLKSLAAAPHRWKETLPVLHRRNRHPLQHHQHQRRHPRLPTGPSPRRSGAHHGRPLLCDCARLLIARQEIFGRSTSCQVASLYGLPDSWMGAPGDVGGLWCQAFAV
ncbi:MAG: ybaK/ebsC protein, partial [Bryobacterales bacterium]|nr:ybaK/ebsC protein [Bryobacterales bacterium]